MAGSDRDLLRTTVHFDDVEAWLKWAKDKGYSVDPLSKTGPFNLTIDMARTRSMTVMLGRGRSPAIRYPVTDGTATASSGYQNRNSYMLVYFMKGAGQQVFGQSGRVALLHPGEMLLLDADNEFWRSESEADCQIAYYFLPKETLQNWEAVFGSVTATVLHSDSAWGLQLARYLSTITPETLLELCGNATLSRNLSAQIAELIRNAMGNQFQDILHAHADDSEESRDAALRSQVLQWIDQNLADPKLNVPRIAEHFGLSTRQLYRIMQPDGEKESLHNALIRLRVTHAAQLLADASKDHLSITEIGVASGIPNASTFHRNFRTYHLTTPAKYRHRHRNRAAPARQLR